MRNKPPIAVDIILTRPMYESNIGAVARICSNFKVRRLILIAPKCPISLVAYKSAATGSNFLRFRSEYTTLVEAFAKDGVRIALSARGGRGRPLTLLTSALSTLYREPSNQSHRLADRNVQLIFGPEDAGLDRSDLELCHFVCELGVTGDNVSLNLSQAVLLALYQLSQFAFPSGEKNFASAPTDAKSPDKNLDRIFPESTLKNFISILGYDISRSRINAYTILRRSLLQNVPTEKELKVLETIFQQATRKIADYNLWYAKKKS